MICIPQDRLLPGRGAVLIKVATANLEEASDMLSTLDATLRWLCNCLLFLQIMQQRQGEIGGPAESHTAKM